MPPVTDRYGVEIKVGDDVYDHRETLHPDKYWRVTGIRENGLVSLESGYICRDGHYPPCRTSKSLYRVRSLQVIGG